MGGPREGRWPRQYAADVLACASSAERKAALQQVPEEFRAWVRHLVEDYFWRRSLRRSR